MSAKIDTVLVFGLLRSGFPTKRAILLRCQKMKHFGSCSAHDEQIDGPITLTLNKDSDRDMQVDTLMHEFAHAIIYDAGDFSGKHDSNWGICYAKIYDYVIQNYVKSKLFDKKFKK